MQAYRMFIIYAGSWRHVKGFAGPGLLATYHTERHSIGEFYAIRSGNMASANGLVNETSVVENMKDLIGLPDYRYASAAIINGSAAVIAETSMHDILGLPGSRIPHIWLDNEKKLSLLDLIKGRFMFIMHNHNPVKEARLYGICQNMNIPLQVVTISNYPNAVAHWNNVMNDFHNDELILVRPDGFIAWRGIDNGQTDLEAILQKLLSLT